MKATDLKCPNCGAEPTDNAWQFELVEPATAYRRLAFVVKDGELTDIKTTSLEHDDGVGDRMLKHVGCEEHFKIPEGFWDFDVYG